MRTIFSTADVPQAAAFDYWLAAARATITGHDLKALEDRHNWYGELRAGTLGDVTIASYQLAPAIASVTGAGDGLLLVLSSSRTAITFEGKHGVELNRSNFCLVDQSTPQVSHAVAFGPTKALSVSIPRDALARRIRIERGVVNRPISRGSADAALLEGFVRHLAQLDPSNLSPTAATLARLQLLDLTAVVFGGAAGVTPMLGAAENFVLLRLQAAIERNPNADRESIAAAAGISVRHANRLLAPQGTSIQRLLTERRLGMCREAIENQRHRKISDIAFAYGFRDLSHFGRAFKSRFGLTPSDHRAAFASTGQQSPRRPSDEG